MTKLSFPPLYLNYLTAEFLDDWLAVVVVVLGSLLTLPYHPHLPRILTMERKITLKTSCNFEYNGRKQVHLGLMDTIVFVDNSSNKSATQCNSSNQSIVTIIIILGGIKYCFY